MLSASRRSTAYRSSSAPYLKLKGRGVSKLMDRLAHTVQFNRA
jgi:hypothetical protein